MNVSEFASLPYSRETFYPTPPKLGKKLLAGIKWENIHSVLEPSAGKGDLVRCVAEKHLVKRYERHNIAGQLDVDCVEIDPYLRDILLYEFSDGRKHELGDLRWRLNEKEDRNYKLPKEKRLSPEEAAEKKMLGHEYDIRSAVHVRLVHDDFLTFESRKHYDLIVMNPPFADGDAHLLHAIQLQERFGGRVRCILNAETIRNPYTKRRQLLMEKLEEWGAKITYEDHAFADAERATDVSVAIIKLRIPEPKTESDIFTRLRKAADLEDTPIDDVSDLTVTDFFSRIVTHFNVEVDAGLALIREYNAMRPYIMGSFKKESYDSPTLTLHVGDDSSRYYSGRKPDVNKFIKLVRAKYWTALFSNKEFMGRLTSNLQKKYYAMIGQLSAYDFTLFNIQQIVTQMNAEMSQGIQDTILALFEKMTTAHSWYPECNKNTHYFNGWATNKAHKINTKVILPVNGMFSDYSWSKTFEVRAAAHTISDIEKVFDFLDGDMTAPVNLYGVLERACAEGQTKNIPCKFFDVTLYKKGTMHIRFRNQELVDRFNIYCCGNKGWLPPNYGKKAYDHMSKAEQCVVDAFHGDGSVGSGKESYATVLAKADYFLAQPTRKVPLLAEPSQMSA